MASFEEDFFEVLKSIESAIVVTYGQQPELVDRQIGKALNSLTRLYATALKERNPPTLRMDPATLQVFNNLKAAMEAHMTDNGAGEMQYISLEEAIRCLKRIQRSVDQMAKQHGANGTAYLEFVKGYQSR